MDDLGDQSGADAAEAAHRSTTARLHRRAAQLIELTGWAVDVVEPPRGRVQLRDTADRAVHQLHESPPYWHENGDDRAPIRTGKRVVMTSLDTVISPGTHPLNEFAELLHDRHKPALSVKLVTGRWFDSVRTGEHFSQQADGEVLVMTDGWPGDLGAWPDGRELARDMSPRSIPPSLAAAVMAFRAGRGRPDGQQRGRGHARDGGSRAGETSAGRARTRRGRLPGQPGFSAGTASTPDR